MLYGCHVAVIFENSLLSGNDLSMLNTFLNFETPSNPLPIETTGKQGLYPQGLVLGENGPTDEQGGFHQRNLKRSQTIKTYCLKITKGLTTMVFWGY